MTLVLDRPITESPTNAGTPVRRRRRSRFPAWLTRRPDLLWPTPVLLLSTVVNAWGLMKSPQRVDDEGTYMAQAYAVQKFGELAHYTYWYDHPPLGWLQLAAVTTLTGAFSWPISAVAAGRVIMLGVNVVAGILMWLLARRLDLSRPAAAAAVAIFSLSPLAVTFRRMVYLDNIAVVWTLAAFVLAAARHHQLVAFCGSAASFAMAVLTKETFVLLLPALVWLMWQHAVPATRRYTMAMSASLFVLLCSGYLAFSALKSELVPGEQRVSLLEGIRYQLVERPGSGAIWESDTSASQTFAIWMSLDAVLLVGGAVGAVAMLAVKRMRPLALSFILLAAMLLRTGYLPTPYVVAMIPFAALLIAAATDHGLRRRRWRPVAAVGAATAVLLAAPAWATDLRSATEGDADQPMRQAQSWIIDHVDRDERVLIDDAIWVDLVRAGFPRRSAVWYFKADTDPAVIKMAPRGWRDYDFLMVTSAVRGTLDIAGRGEVTPYPRVTAAYRHSEAVASFGTGHDRVEIRRIGADPAGRAKLPSPEGSSAPEQAPPALPPPATEPPEADVEEPSGSDDEGEESNESGTAQPAPPPPPGPPPTPAPSPTPTEQTPGLSIRLGSPPGEQPEPPE